MVLPERRPRTCWTSRPSAQSGDRSLPFCGVVLNMDLATPNSRATQVNGTPPFHRYSKYSSSPVVRRDPRPWGARWVAPRGSGATGVAPLLGPAFAAWWLTSLTSRVPGFPCGGDCAALGRKVSLGRYRRWGTSQVNPRRGSQDQIEGLDIAHLNPADRYWDEGWVQQPSCWRVRLFPPASAASHM